MVCIIFYHFYTFYKHLLPFCQTLIKVNTSGFKVFSVFSVSNKKRFRGRLFNLLAFYVKQDLANYKKWEIRY